MIITYKVQSSHSLLFYRPIAGYVNFCPESLANLKDSKLFAVTKHEILHALVIICDFIII